MNPEIDASDSDLFTEVDAEQESAEDSPIENEEQNTDEQPEADTGAPEQDEPAAPAEQQPPKKQSKQDDSRFAAARKGAESKQKAIEAQLAAEKQRMDAFAQSVGYKDFPDMERGEAVKRYVNQGMSEEVATELAALKAEKAQLRAEREEIERTKAADAQWESLFREFPETNKADFELDPKVLELIDAGETPLNAYRAFMVKKQADELAALKQNSATKAKSIGSVKGKAPVQNNYDPFLDGLG